MNKIRRFPPLALTLLILLTSCNLARGTTDGGTTGDSVADSQTLVALAVQQTQAAAGLLEPAFTFTPFLTPTITLTSTPEVPMVTVSQATNCRTGPGEPYDIIGTLPVGIPAEIIGKNASGDTWIIKLPSNPSVTCWLWGHWGTVEGDTDGLTVFTPPPTPTPAAGFSVSYLGTVNCMGWYGFRFQLTNTGSLTWESYRVDVTDLTFSISKYYITDEFTDLTPGCIAVAATLMDLTPGEVGVAGNWSSSLFNYPVAGHNFTATFKLCSQNGLAGTCVDRSVSFTP